MRKGKYKKWLLGISLAAMAGFGVTGAYFTDQISVVNKIRMGDVDIALREFSLENGKEVSYQNPQSIQPGDIISKIPRITNLAEPCWIRARIQYVNNKEELEGFSDENLSGFSGKWKKRGEYYYYTEVVEENEAVDLFHQVFVPTGWDGNHNEQNLLIEIQADAIQAVHFSPDFEAMSPWGNQEIELCVHERNDRIVEKEETLKHKIEFNGEAHKLISISEDFFSNFGTAMPGDVLSDTASLENTTKNPATLYFHTESVGKSEEENDLLNQLKLELKMDGKRLYYGKLENDVLSKEHELIQLESGEKGTLEFSVYVPEELKNVYALNKAEVKWIFRVEEEAPVGNPTPKPSESNTESDPLSFLSPIKTGDARFEELLSLILTMLLSASAAGTALYRGGKRK